MREQLPCATSSFTHTLIEIPEVNVLMSRLGSATYCALLSPELSPLLLSSMHPPPTAQAPASCLGPLYAVSLLPLAAQAAPCARAVAPPAPAALRYRCARRLSFLTALAAHPSWTARCSWRMLALQLGRYLPRCAGTRHRPRRPSTCPPCSPPRPRASRSQWCRRQATARTIDSDSCLRRRRQRKVQCPRKKGSRCLMQLRSQSPGAVSGQRGACPA
eukprot:2828669-Rhodomonas_salina.1